MARGLIHPLTGGRRIRPTSPSSRSARQLKPGRPSTYQAEDAVQTNRASSEPRLREPIGRAGVTTQNLCGRDAHAYVGRSNKLGTVMSVQHGLQLVQLRTG